MYQINEFGIGLSLEPDKKCIPEDCWCSYYDNPYDNYYHTHYLTPAQKYFFWVQEWKKDFQEICNDCKKLGQSSYSKDYIKGVLDTVSPEYPLNTFMKEVRQEEQSSLFDFEIPG